MKYLASVIVVCTLFLYSAKAQNSSLAADSSTAVDEKSWELRVPVTTFFERYNSINLGVFREGKESLSWGLELGYIFGMYRLYGIGFSGEFDEGFTNPIGGKLMAHFRFDLVEKKSFDEGKWYIDFAPYLYYINYDIDLIAGYECNDERNNCTYYRLFETNTHRFVPGIFTNIEKVYTLGSTTLTFHAGLGLRYTINVDQIPEVPEVGQLYVRNGEQSKIPEGLSSNVKLGFVVGYKFK
ncbi:MAG: hypothetical protein ACI9L9_001402 [Marivirga sp.]